MGKKPKRKATLDDGLNPELVAGARWEGALRIPCIERPQDIITPDGFTPFSERLRAPTDAEALAFFEMDVEFADVLINPELYIEEFSSWPIFVPPDCSAYRDAPPWAQLLNIVRSRSIGFYYQKRGANVYPLCRWGDETTYTTCLYGEKPAFLGLPHESPIVVSNYGCLRGYEDEFHFRQGLIAMIEELNPSLILVHGSMNDRVFRGLQSRADFMQFDNWTTRMHKGGGRRG